MTAITRLLSLAALSCSRRRRGRRRRDDRRRIEMSERAAYMSDTNASISVLDVKVKAIVFGGGAVYQHKHGIFFAISMCLRSFTECSEWQN